MADASASILSALKEKGYRMTSSRQAILKAVLKASKPFSAWEMHGAVAKKGSSTDKVTVYRELQVLEKEGILQSAKFQDGTKRYCLASHGHHHHLICTNCSDVQDVEMEDDLTLIEKKIQKEKKFTVSQHTLEFYGLCSKCA